MNEAAQAALEKAASKNLTRDQCYAFVIDEDKSVDRVEFRAALDKINQPPTEEVVEEKPKAKPAPKFKAKAKVKR